MIDVLCAVNCGCFRSEHELPWIYFNLPSSASVLRALYDVTTVKDDNSLYMEIGREKARWNLRVKGELLSCPGE